jgi:putative membrane protein
MNAFQPGFLDEAPPPEPVRVETIERPLDPGFIDSTSVPPETVPAPLPMPLSSPGLGPLGWVGAGLGILVLGGSLLSLIGFVVDQMARSPVLGWVSFATVAAGVVAILWGAMREIRSYRRLTRVDALPGWIPWPTHCPTQTRSGSR